MKIKRLFRPLHWLVMRCTGVVYRKRDGKNKLIVTVSGYVIMSDGQSKDALPLNLVSQDLIDEIEAHLKGWGYA